MHAPGCQAFRHPGAECSCGYTRGMAKRGYSREFTPRTDRRIKIEIDRVPPSIADALRAKCKREGISVRALTLQLWKEWAGRRPPQDAKGQGQ